MIYKFIIVYIHISRFVSGCIPVPPAGGAWVLLKTLKKLQSGFDGAQTGQAFCRIWWFHVLPTVLFTKSQYDHAISTSVKVGEILQNTFKIPYEYYESM